MRRTWLAAVGVAAAWCVARTLMVLDWYWKSGYITSDVAYYFGSLRDPGSQALTEYPTPLLWILRLTQLASGNDYYVFFTLLVALMVALDALVTAYLFWRASPLAAIYWVVFLTLLGPIMWFRLDLIPAVAVTLGLTEAFRHPRFCGIMLAIGAATKLWPALLMLPLIGRDKVAGRRLISFGVAGGGLAIASLIANGWHRSISPIIWQLGRGLQIESLSATWLMIKRATTPGVLDVDMSTYNAYELFGPGVSAWQSVATVLTVIAVVFTLCLTAWLFRVKAPGRGFVVLLAATAIITAFIAADKTFSPQYLIWLAGPLGLMLAWAKTPAQRRTAFLAAGLGLVIAGVTQVIFPIMYDGLLSYPTGQSGVTALLVARNILMAAFTIWLCATAAVVAWRAYRAAR